MPNRQAKRGMGKSRGTRSHKGGGRWDRIAEERAGKSSHAREHARYDKSLWGAGQFDETEAGTLDLDAMVAHLHPSVRDDVRQELAILALSGELSTDESAVRREAKRLSSRYFVGQHRSMDAPVSAGDTRTLHDFVTRPALPPRSSGRRLGRRRVTRPVMARRVEAMRARGLSWKEIARAFGTSRRTLFGWRSGGLPPMKRLTGRPTVRVVQKHRCQWCSELFYSLLVKRTLCSNDCASHLRHRKIPRDSAKEIARLYVEERLSSNQIGTRYGVSGQAIRRTLRADGVTVKRRVNVERAKKWRRGYDRTYRRAHPRRRVPCESCYGERTRWPDAVRCRSCEMRRRWQVRRVGNGVNVGA